MDVKWTKLFSRLQKYKNVIIDNYIDIILQLKQLQPGELSEMMARVHLDKQVHRKL